MKILATVLATLLFATSAAAAAPSYGPRHGTRDHRVEQRTSWKTLATVQAQGAKTAIRVDRRAGKIDDLRLEVSRGTVAVKSVIVTFANGKRYTAPVNRQLTAGKPYLVRIPGAAQWVSRVELIYATPRGVFAPHAFMARRAQITISAR
jgi:hypothetical protein